MNRTELVRRVRSLTRDFSNSIFREQDIIDFLNEAINRSKQIVPKLKGMEKLLSNAQDITHIPEEYQHLLAVYSASRCYGQDERHYQSATLMNEYEIKMEEFKSFVDSGEVSIIDPETGFEVEDDGVLGVEYVDTTNYFVRNKRGGR